MTDITNPLAVLKSLRRPRLLIRAARFGLAEYNRERDLKRLMRATRAPSPRRAMEGLLALEAELEAGRKNGAASYSVARHVEALIALMAESRLVSE
ncbi:MAG TPA: hypothetical protein ENK45_00745 [Aliiroseovarius sp.]|nr:hypothetical protein [Aliiroseovarius sp.]